MPNYIQKLNPVHEALINLRLAQPYLSQGEIATILGYQQAWVSRIECSDLYRVELRKRAEMAGVRLHMETLKNKIESCTSMVIEKIEDRLTNGQPVSEKFLGDSLKTLLSASEYGRAAGPQSGPQLHVHMSAEELRSLREGSLQAFQGKTEVKALRDDPDPGQGQTLDVMAL